MHPLLFVTSNANKAKEVKAILGNEFAVEVVAFDAPEIQGSIEDIAQDKCRRVAESLGRPVLVEDSSLEIRALNGLPGPYVKTFVERLGNEGILQLMEPYKDRSAQAVCTLAYCSDPGGDPVVFVGRLEGLLVPERGSSTFGWEPIFEHDGQTLAEMDDDFKNQISHRYQALEKFKDWFLQKKN